MKPFPFHGVNSKLRPHIQSVLDGEYDIPGIKFTHAPTILDIGANVGSYSYWALARFPDAFIFAYEPDVANAAAYTKNLTETFGSSNQWRLFNSAVSDADTDTITFYKSAVNAGMHSIFPGMTNTACAEVTTVNNTHPHRLPDCSILKLDTEGCEVPILKSYLKSHTLPAIISFEYHSRFDYYELDQILTKDGYIPMTGEIRHADIGTLNYIHHDVV